MGRATHLLIATALVLLSLPVPASAQPPLLGIGGSVAIVGAPNELVHGVPRINPLVRFGETRDGWGARIGFGWYSADVDQPVGGAAIEAGRLRVRPIMGGYGYTRVFGAIAVSGNVLAGYAITSFRATDAFRDAYREDSGAERVSIQVSNEWVMKPEISTWLDVSRKVGVNISLGYMVARPTMTVESDLGRDERGVRADVWMFRMGAAYAIF